MAGDEAGWLDKCPVVSVEVVFLSKSLLSFVISLLVVHFLTCACHFLSLSLALALVALLPLFSTPQSLKIFRANG